GAEHHVAAERVGDGIQLTRRLLGGESDMNPDPRKVVPEALLHLLPQGRLQRNTGIRKGAIYADGRRVRLSAWRSGMVLNVWPRCTGVPRSRHHLRGDAIRFLLIRIARRV